MTIVLLFDMFDNIFLSNDLLVESMTMSMREAMRGGSVAPAAPVRSVRR